MIVTVYYKEQEVNKICHVIRCTLQNVFEQSVEYSSIVSKEVPNFNFFKNCYILEKKNTSKAEPSRKTRVRVRRPVAHPQRPPRAGVDEERALITGPRAGSAAFGYDGFCQSTDRGGEDATDHQPKTTYLQQDSREDRRFLD